MLIKLNGEIINSFPLRLERRQGYYLSPFLLKFVHRIWCNKKRNKRCKDWNEENKTVLIFKGYDYLYRKSFLTIYNKLPVLLSKQSQVIG